MWGSWFCNRKLWGNYFELFGRGVLFVGETSSGRDSNGESATMAVGFGFCVGFFRVAATEQIAIGIFHFN